MPSKKLKYAMIVHIAIVSVALKPSDPKKIFYHMLFIFTMKIPLWSNISLSNCNLLTPFMIIPLRLHV
jgi:hypothetical protein